MLPLAGCGTGDSDVADPTNETTEINSPGTDDSGGSAEQLTQEVTASNKVGSLEVTIMVPDSWYSWGPEEGVQRGHMMTASIEFGDDSMSVSVLDPERGYGCTPEDLVSEQCYLVPVEYEDYEILESITIDGYEAYGVEYVADFDDYKTREQQWHFDVDGDPLRFRITSTVAEEELPQIVFDIRDSTTVKVIG